MNQPTPLPRGHILRDCTYIGTEMISRRRAEDKPIKVMSDLDARGKVIKARFRPDPLAADAIPAAGEFGFRQDADGWELVFTDPDGGIHTLSF